MKKIQKTKPKRKFNLGLTKEVASVIISVVSFIISMISAYFNTAKAPDISFVTAPYVKHVVDNASLNEAFFIPVTIANRGARSGTILSFDLQLENPQGETQTYTGQYFTANGSNTSLGDFFAPITLSGYSSDSRTIAFYPEGFRQGNFFSQMGTYEFTITGEVTNVRNETLKTTKNVFTISVDKSMVDSMNEQPDGEFIYPMSIELVSME